MCTFASTNRELSFLCIVSHGRQRHRLLSDENKYIRSNTSRNGLTNRMEPQTILPLNFSSTEDFYFALKSATATGSFLLNARSFICVKLLDVIMIIKKAREQNVLVACWPDPSCLFPTCFCCTM